MLTDKENSQLLSQSWARKASIFLLGAEKVINNLCSTQETYAVCQEAVNKCWLWLSDSSLVLPHELSYYIDDEHVQSGCLNEKIFVEGSVEQNTLIFILMVVALFANRSYSVSGIPEAMSESVCEADDSLLPFFFDLSSSLGVEGFLRSHLINGGVDGQAMEV